MGKKFFFSFWQPEDLAAHEATRFSRLAEVTRRLFRQRQRNRNSGLSLCPFREVRVMKILLQLKRNVYSVTFKSTDQLLRNYVIGQGILGL